MKRRVPAKVQIGRFFRKVLPAILILLAGMLIVLVVIAYKVTHPAAVPEFVNPSHFLLPWMDVSWVSGDGTVIDGWWIPGLKGAPGIVLAPGLGMSRSEVLSLAASLHEKGFNILTYDQRGSGKAPRAASSLGLRETDDLLTALDFLKKRQEVSGTSLGIWGADVGARAALKAAASRPEVRALAADSPYDAIADFIGVRMREDLGSENRLLEFGCRETLRLYMLLSGMSLNERLPLEALADRRLLFIRGENRKELARLTMKIYDQIQPQKEMISLANSRGRLTSGEELRSYDRQVANFFQINLP